MTSKPPKLYGCHRHRHPSQPITGFCASCLRERLEGIESSSTPHHDHPTNSNDSNDHQCPPQHRRTKSCSGRDPLTASEPSRRSCEDKVKNTLSDLFNVDNERKGLKGSLDFEVGNVGFEIREEELDEVDERRVSEIVVDEGPTDEIISKEDAMTMKEFIDLELQSRKSNAGGDFKEIAGSLWEVTSTFTKRLRKWRRKHKLKKNGDDEGDGGLMGLKGVKISVKGLRGTRSNIGEPVSGRMSCDTDPRLSTDAGRMSVDDSRFSFDEPRASWNGCLIGKASHPRLIPLVSVVENVKSPPVCENRDLVEWKEQFPTNLSWERRRSLDSSIYTMKKAISEADELKLISNYKVSPATTELFCGAKLLITEKELMEKNFGSVGNAQSGCNKDNHAKDASDIIVGTCDKGSKKSQKWRGVLNMLGMVQQKTEGGVEYKEGSASENIDKPTGESRLANGEIRLISHQIICSSSASGRDPHITELCNNFHSTKANGISAKEKHDIMLMRNRSSKDSPHGLDNGLLRFYLTPSRSYRRSKSSKSWLKVLYPTGRNVL